jgi:hypothetical protein
MKNRGYALGYIIIFASILYIAVSLIGKYKDTVGNKSEVSPEQAQHQALVNKNKNLSTDEESAALQCGDYASEKEKLGFKRQEQYENCMESKGYNVK